MEGKDYNKTQCIKKQLIKHKHISFGDVCPKQMWSSLIVYVLGPGNSGSSSKTVHIVLFPGLNSTIQDKQVVKMFAYSRTNRGVKN